jgi:hypothetical protein
MDDLRDRAFTLAHEAETKDGQSDSQAVISRAQVYLEFLRGKSDAAKSDAA